MDKNQNPSYFEHCHHLAKQRCKESAETLLRLLLKRLKTPKSLEPCHIEYLIECLERAISLKDANKAFYLAHEGKGRGKSLSSTTKGLVFAQWQSSNINLSHEERIEKLSEWVREQHLPIGRGKKAIERIITQGNKNPLEFGEYAKSK